MHPHTAEVMVEALLQVSLNSHRQWISSPTSCLDPLQDRLRGFGVQFGQLPLQ